ncbi:MAG: DUF5615 family PIN-like protein [Dehalococcoidia bacterium]|nr:DUF5615 family PIN-like protein [Dehalococcoidia bacterium]
MTAFLVDNSMSPVIARLLVTAGEDAVHVRDLGMAAAPDDEILARARDEGRVVIAADTDFGTLLARDGGRSPSVILFRERGMRRPAAQGELLVRLLPSMHEALEAGSLVVIFRGLVRIRPLPIG